MLTLLVGGSADGTVVELAPSVYRSGLVLQQPVVGQLYVEPDVDWADDTIMVEKVIYLPTKIVLFGSSMIVHVIEGTPMERIEATLTEHLLNDTAKSLVNAMIM